MDKTQLYECKPCGSQKFYSDPKKNAPHRVCEHCSQPLHKKRPARAPRPVVISETDVDGVKVAHADATGSP